MWREAGGGGCGRCGAEGPVLRRRGAASGQRLGVPREVSAHPRGGGEGEEGEGAGGEGGEEGGACGGEGGEGGGGGFYAGMPCLQQTIDRITSIRLCWYA